MSLIEHAITANRKSAELHDASLANEARPEDRNFNLHGSYGLNQFCFESVRYQTCRCGRDSERRNGSNSGCCCGL